MMTIRYLCHASFLITTSAGTRVVTDPLDPDGYPGSLTYRPFNEPADVVTISHEHADHNGVRVVKNSPIVIRGNGVFSAAGVDFMGVDTRHDSSGGSQRGANTVFIITADELRVAHFGDLGHVLTADQAAEIGSVDVALLPVGGHFTIDAAEAKEVAEQVSARVIIPMHYKTGKCAFPIAGVEAFVEGKPNVLRHNGSEIEITRDLLPESQQIIVLMPAL